MKLPIASDQPLSLNQRTILDIVLDQMIPADSKRQKPSAVDVHVYEYISERNPASFEEIGRQLDELESRATASYKKRYSELTRDLQDRVLSLQRDRDPRFLLSLALQAVECYYLDSRVTASIGLPSRAPYPDGYTVHRGDLSLLDPVRQRGQIWRRP